MRIYTKAKAWVQLQVKSWFDPILRQIASQQENGASGYSYNKAVKSGYLGTDIVFSGVDLLSAGVASVPLRAMKRLPDGKSEPMPDNHPLNKLLKKPNPRQKGNNFMYAAAAFRLLGGDCNIWVNTGAIDPLDADAEPLEMWALAPTAATLRSENGQFFYQTNRQGDNCGGMKIMQRTIPVDPITGRSNIIQWSTFNPESLCKGVSPLQAANVNIDIYRFGNFWNRNYFKHGCRPSTALVAAEELGDKTFNRLKKQLDELYSGLENGNGRPLLLDGGVVPNEMSANPKDADFENSHAQAQKDILRTMRIPPILLALGSDATFSNQAEARLYVWDETIILMTNDLVDELNLNLVPRYRDPDLFIEADYSKIPALEPRRIEMWKRAEESDDLTVNETRAMKGYPPIGTEGDVVFVDSNKIPLSMAAVTIPPPKGE